MTILQALDSYYGRMAERGEADDLGFTRENIGYSIVLGREGSLRDVIDLRQNLRGKLRPLPMSVPRPKRTSNIQSNFLWDKTAYAFGVDSGKSKRLVDEHRAFVDFHLEMLSEVDDEHAKALVKFIVAWIPAMFSPPFFKPEMLDESFVFRFDDEHLCFHQVPLLREKWLSSLGDQTSTSGFCLVSGRFGSIEAGHPVIKGVDGAQTAGAYLVAINADAYTSYGKPKDATNAPTSKAAAARYGAALNRLLDRGASRNRIKIGDATVTFWADASGVGEDAAAAAEDVFAAMMDPPSDESQAAKLRDILEVVEKGRPALTLDPQLVPGTRFHVLGLAPNAARLSVRFWLTDDFEAFAERLASHYRDLEIEPAPWKTPPSVQRLLVRTTALQQKFDNIPPLLAGEVARAVLTGSAYPRTLLAAAIIRLRAGDDPGWGWHAAVIKACINRSLRSSEEPLPVARDPDNKSEAYQLGRLFYVLEAAQRAALGRVNASIADRYYGAASSTPARVFGPLLRGLRNHVSDARKRNFGGWIEPRVAEIMSHLPPDLPKTLSLEDQGRFAVGYYHERGTRPTKEVETAEAGEKGDGE